jgi:hypothetical protein
LSIVLENETEEEHDDVEKLLEDEE